MDYAEMKVAAKKLGIKSVGVKKEKMLDSILDKIEEMMDVEGWVEAHQDLMTIYNAETETEADEEEEGVETSEGIEVNEDELAEAEEKAKVAKEKADKKKAEKKAETGKPKATKRNFIEGLLSKKFHTLEDLHTAFQVEYPDGGNSLGNLKSHINNIKKAGISVDYNKEKGFRIVKDNK